MNSFSKPEKRRIRIGFQHLREEEGYGDKPLPLIKIKK
jgi:hypothetical protein